MKHFVKTKRLEVWGHAQNLHKFAGRGGSILSHGRAWLHVSRASFGLEWRLSPAWSRLGVIIGGEEDDLVLILRLWKLFSLYFSVHDLVPYRWRGYPRGWGRETSLGFIDGDIVLKIWYEDDSWSCDSPWFRRLYFRLNLKDLILGSSKSQHEVLGQGTTVVPLPEGTYRARWVKILHTWQRSRWPWPTRIIRYELEPETPIPIPAKGENAWDMDDDAIHSVSCAASTLPEAVARLVQSALRDRERYGWDGETNFVTKEDA